MKKDQDKPQSVNRLGLSRSDYVGLKSTLCTGCGHDSVTNHLISALFQSGIEPTQVAKVSGIGCSSKTPTYFLNQAHGFNSIHGRMAPLATGAWAAQQSLKFIGISGDGDTASIGLGGFAHLVRRDTPLLYIVENNGVYGLTKGQFSATADQGSALKSGFRNPFSEIDLCTLALDLGASFVARSFSGDAKQLVPLFRAALQHPGLAFIDVVSPCVTFANHEGSTKSFKAVKAADHRLHELGLYTSQNEIQIDYAEGELKTIELPDGTFLSLRKTDQDLHDLKDRKTALSLLRDSREKGEILTGLFYMDSETKHLGKTLKLPKQNLAHLTEQQLKPSAKAFNHFIERFT